MDREGENLMRDEYCYFDGKVKRCHKVSQWYDENILNGEYWGSTKRELKLLGVTLDEQLRFTTHISNVCRKVLSVWNQEYKNCNKSVTKNYYVRWFAYLAESLTTRNGHSYVQNKK